MLKAIVNDSSGYMEVDVAQEHIESGNIQIEKVAYRQGSPLMLCYFSDKGVALQETARVDMHKATFIDQSPIIMQRGDPVHDKLGKLAVTLFQAWKDAAAHIAEATPQVEFLTATGQPFTNFGTFRP